MLSDEEREALEILKSFEPDDLVECAIYSQALEKIMNLIEKQSKEIEELNKALMTATLKIEGLKIEAVYDDNYVSKDKIKAKIEELQEHIKYSANPLSIDNSKFGIKVLQSLLEERRN